MQHTVQNIVTPAALAFIQEPKRFTVKPAVCFFGVVSFVWMFRARIMLCLLVGTGCRYTRLCTVVGNEDGVTVGTIEHLMAALAVCGVDNAVIELDGPEVPIMDGSSEPFIDAILMPVCPFRRLHGGRSRF